MRHLPLRRSSTLSLAALAAAVFALASLAAPSRAAAANVLLVSDSGADLNIAMALEADGHTVTTITGDFATGNTALTGDLSAYDVVYWSANGAGYGDAHSSMAVFTNLSAYVTGGGRVFVTGYDSIASPTDPLLIAFVGGTGSRDVPPSPGVILDLDTPLTTGAVDLRGVTPRPTSGDRDSVTGLMADTVSVITLDSDGGSQWTLRTLGSGYIAYVGNGDSGTGASASWTTTSPTDGSHAYNGALRNFAFSASGASGTCSGEGTTCMTSAGRSGTCHASRCCTGCWDGTRCNGGTSAARCGVAGGACVTCTDGDACTTDACTAGRCTFPSAPAGTSCDDGLFCTLTDRCDGAGRCAGSGSSCDDMASCTLDMCDEARDSCSHTMGAGCIIGGVCVPDGMVHPSITCLVCDATRNATDWSPRTVGTPCGAPRCASGRLTEMGMCSAAGACTVPASVRCPTGMCASTTACEVPCTAGSCAPGTYCSAAMRCEPLAANGTSCTAGTDCVSGACVDGVCCDTACDGVCESCNVSGRAGTCAPVPRATDPARECMPGFVCNGARACVSDPTYDAGASMPDAGPPDAGAPDAGLDAPDAGMGAVDAGPPVGFDAGLTPTPPPTRRGCSCRVGTRDGDLGGLASIVALALALAARRRR